MASTLYHSTTERLSGTLRDGFCATSDRRASLGYVAHARRAYCYCVRTAEAVAVASEIELWDAAEAVGVAADYAFELADEASVRAELARRGFGAVRYQDMSPDNTTEHDCVRACVDGALVLAEIGC